MKKRLYSIAMPGPHGRAAWRTGLRLQLSTAIPKRIILGIIIMRFITSAAMAQAQQPAPETVVQANLDAYNQRDIDAFMASFSEDITLYNWSDTLPATAGLAAVRARYKNLFDASPKLHSTILKRIVFDNKVIDHEYIIGRMGADTPVELILIYEVRGDKIFKVTVIRK